MRPETQAFHGLSDYLGGRMSTGPHQTDSARVALTALSAEECRFLVPSAAIGYVGALSWAGQRNGATLIAHI
jgi:hypothetical protein